jgi:hypothetical protein
MLKKRIRWGIGLYAHQFEDEKGRHIVLATDRPGSMAEAWRGGRSMDLQSQSSSCSWMRRITEGWLGFAMKLKMDPEKG